MTTLPKPRITPKGDDYYEISYRGHTGSIRRNGPWWDVAHYRPNQNVGNCGPRMSDTADALRWLVREIDTIENPIAALVAVDKFRAGGNGPRRLVQIHAEAMTALERFQRDLGDRYKSESAMVGIANLFKVAGMRKLPAPVTVDCSTKWTKDISAKVTPKVCIEIHGRTYFVGDLAEHSSYNKSYIGTIVSITAKTVTISKGHGKGNRRLSIESFCSRNRKSVEEKAAANARWSD